MIGKDQNSDIGKETQFSSTNQPDNSGRKKKIYTILKEKGYSGDDIKTAFGEMAWYTLGELQEVHKDDAKPVIMRIVANQLFLALKKGDWTKIKEILEHVIGKPTTNLNHQGDLNLTHQVIGMRIVNSGEEDDTSD